MAFISVSTVLITVLLVWAVRRMVARLARQTPNYPPGPKPKPLIGNMLDFPNKNSAKIYADWGKKYNSDILYAEALGSHVVILNRLEDALELFEKHDRARMYSDRPSVPIIKMMGWDSNSGLLPYGDEWRLHRKIAQQNLSTQATRRYESVQAKKVRQMLQGLLSTPEDFGNHNKMFSVSLMISLMYGYEITSITNPLVTVADEAIMLGTQLIAPGGSLINVIPALRYIPTWFPGASTRRQAAKVRHLTDEIKRIPMDFVRRSFEEGKAPPSFVTNFYEKMHTTGASQEEEKAVQGVAYTVYGAASDTTISATGTFFYSMVVNPDVQKKAHAEIDRVIGSQRLPTLDDRKSLPYVEAIYREIMRLRPPLPTGVPHLLLEDDVYKGYFIPKGTTILPNIWSMTHNEEVYPEPFKFRPERFFDINGNLNDDSRVLAYGFGRRICVGRHLASSTMWLMIASVLACFHIEKAKDKDGNEIDIDDSYNDNGFVQQKSDFQCSFRIRSPVARKLVLDDL